MNAPDLPRITLRVIEVFDLLQIPYRIGGSLASSALGVPRATLDADLVADLRLPHAEPLATALQSDFYVSVAMIREAVRGCGSFNLLHLASGFKVDVFVLKNRAFDRQAFARVVLRAWPDEHDPPVAFSTAEDILLHKLEWYRLGDEISDRHWRDIVGVIRVQSDRLDRDYLHKWSVELRVADLLDRAFEEAAM